jgi:hypothetical protein
LAGRRILVAEDEGLVALELERILGDFGCYVVGPLASVEKVLERSAVSRLGRRRATKPSTGLSESPVRRVVPC